MSDKHFLPQCGGMCCPNGNSYKPRLAIYIIDAHRSVEWKTNFGVVFSLVCCHVSLKSHMIPYISYLPTPCKIFIRGLSPDVGGNILGGAAQLVDCSTTIWYLLLLTIRYLIFKKCCPFNV